MVSSSFKNKCVQPLLDAIVNYLPSPLDIDHVKGVNPSSITHLISSLFGRSSTCPVSEETKSREGNSSKGLSMRTGQLNKGIWPGSNLVGTKDEGLCDRYRF